MLRVFWKCRRLTYQLSLCGDVEEGSLKIILARSSNGREGDGRGNPWNSNVCCGTRSPGFPLLI